MESGYKYEMDTCPVCKRKIAGNWFLRHLREAHPDYSNPLTPMSGMELRTAREQPRVALAAASPKLSCTRCECLIFKVELYDEADQPLCRDCYQELYAERDRAEEKWKWADIRIDRRRGT